MENKAKGFTFENFYFDVGDEKKLELFNGSYKITGIDSNDLRILRLLVDQYPNLVSKETIRQKIFPTSYTSHTSDDLIRHSINRLRKVFDDNDREEIIQTIRKQGYKLGVKFEEVREVEPTPMLQPEPKPEPPEPDILLSTIESNDLQNSFKKWLDEFRKQFWGNPFNSWLFDKNNNLAIGVLIVLVLTALVIVVISIINIQKPKEQQSEFDWVVSAIQGLIVFFAVLYPISGINKFNSESKVEKYFNKLPDKTKESVGYSIFDKWDSTSDIAERVWANYKTYWKSIFTNWLFLYVALTIRNFFINGPTEKFSDDQKLFFLTLSLIITFLNYFSSLAFFLCFNILNSPTNFDKENETIEDKTQPIGLGCVALIIALEIFLLWKFFGSNEEISYYLKIFDVISGIVAGVTMALLFGRLQSKFLNPPSWLIITIFTYSAIQALFFYLNKTPYATPIMLLALVFKSLLFLYMNFLFESGRLLFYLVKVRKTYENVEDEFEDVSSLFIKKR